MKKIFWFDTETSGLDNLQNGIISLAFILEIGGEIRDEGCLYMNTIKYGKALNPEALAINGFKYSDIVAFPDPLKVKDQLDNLIARHISKYDRSDKFIPAGFNVRFDLDMLKTFYECMGDRHFWSYFNSRNNLDPMYIVSFLQDSGLLPELDNRKLSTVATYFGIDTSGAHDAIEDIRMTRAVYYNLKAIIQDAQKTKKEST